MKRINKKKVSITIILVVIIVGIIIGLIVYNLGRQEDMSIQREEQNVNTQNVLTGSIENNTENNNVSTEPNTQIQGDEETLENARIKLTVNGNEEVFVSLDDNQASRDFLEMLPLTLTFEDFNSTEKIATLPNELSTEVQPSGYTPEIGDFAYYASLYSLCPSGRNGGNLGCFGRGQMVPSFERKAFSMNVGEVSDPVMTQFGWHLIKINDKK